VPIKVQRLLGLDQLIAEFLEPAPGTFNGDLGLAKIQSDFGDDGVIDMALEG
jgi:hypothetical protein